MKNFSQLSKDLNWLPGGIRYIDPDQKVFYSKNAGNGAVVKCYQVQTNDDFLNNYGIVMFKDDAPLYIGYTGTEEGAKRIADNMAERAKELNADDFKFSADENTGPEVDAVDADSLPKIEESVDKFAAVGESLKTTQKIESMIKRWAKKGLEYTPVVKLKDKVWYVSGFKGDDLEEFFQKISHAADKVLEISKRDDYVALKVVDQEAMLKSQRRRNPYYMESVELQEQNEIGKFTEKAKYIAENAGVRVVVMDWNTYASEEDSGISEVVFVIDENDNKLAEALLNRADGFAAISVKSGEDYEQDILDDIAGKSFTSIAEALLTQMSEQIELGEWNVLKEGN